MRQLIHFMLDFMLVFHLRFPHFIFEAQVGYDCHFFYPPSSAISLILICIIGHVGTKRLGL